VRTSYKKPASRSIFFVFSKPFFLLYVCPLSPPLMGIFYGPGVLTAGLPPQTT